MFKSVVWSSTIDYPNQISTVLFVGNCNMNCEYCHNANLKDSKDIDFESIILPRLLDRKDFINHVVISGGECTCYASLPQTITTLVNNGFKVGIHTNGTNTIMLQHIIKDISFVGMDVKCSDYKKHFNLSDIELENIHKSIKLLVNSGISCEFRTTLYPVYFNEISDIIDIARMLKKYEVNHYMLQEYVNDFNPSLHNPWNKEFILNIVQECNKVITTELKGHIE